ncbi:hypothetical protein AK812_SmicGene35997 [Symbiodinium microadriaticum]|uniref:Uncharacterized protein n=1 Tax=Symbiodinium microadriaticum TaxID=2951 RepID=A0A1Q9CK32_SYMMI|nr:hypothetical protein AK812_SmicGene35997 [Symbiodinium microadriaticum]
MFWPLAPFVSLDTRDGTPHPRTDRAPGIFFPRQLCLGLASVGPVLGPAQRRSGKARPFQVGQVLVTEPLAPGSPDTLRELCDPANRPQEPYARTAAGPSGITNEHLRILLDEEADCTVLPSGLHVQTCRRPSSLPFELAV